MTKQKNERGDEEDLFLMGWDGESLQDLIKLRKRWISTRDKDGGRNDLELQDIVRMALIALDTLLDDVKSEQRAKAGQKHRG